MEIQRLDPDYFPEVKSFYERLIDEMSESPYRPGWEKGVYPSDDMLIRALRNGEIYAGISDNTIIAAMIVNHSRNEGYEGTEWQIDAADNEVLTIHALGVLPSRHGRGFAKLMVQKAIELANAEKQKAIRLDVLGGNEPALRLYEKCGFEYCRTVNMFYEDTGWTDYLLYELVL